MAEFGKDKYNRFKKSNAMLIFQLANIRAMLRAERSDGYIQYT